MKKVIFLIAMLLCTTGFSFSADNNSVDQDKVRTFIRYINNEYNHSEISSFAINNPNEVIYAIRNQRVDANTMVGKTPLAFYMVFSSNDKQVATNSLKIIKTFIQYGYKINTVDENKQTILWEAIEDNMDEMVDFLITSGIDVTIQDKWEETALMYACYYKSREKCALRIIETKKGLDLIDNYGKTALTRAIDEKLDNVAKKLIEAGANVNLCAKEIYCPLYLACDNDNFELVKLLIQKGADVNKKSGYADKTPLFEAMYPDNYEMVKLLLEKGANPNAKDKKYGTTPMFNLDSCKDSRIPEIMIKYGGDINLKDNDGETPFLDVIRFSNKTCIDVFKKYKPNYKVQNVDKGNLFHALMEGTLPKTMYGISDSYSFVTGDTEFDEDIIKLLIDNGVDINAKNKNGETPLMMACNLEFDIPGFAETLIKYGANVNLVDKEKKSALWYAYGNPKIMKVLLDNGANIKQKDKDGQTAYDSAVERASRYPSEKATECVQLLYNANPSAGKNVSLHDALASGNIALSKDLIKNCKDIDELNSNGESYLICAIKSKNTETVKLVLEKKPKLLPYKKGNNSVKTPLTMATENRSVEIVKLLLEYGADPNETIIDTYYSSHSITPFYVLFENDMYNHRNQTEIAELFFQYGADPNAISESYYEYTNFYIAVKYGTSEVVTLFMQNGADPSLYADCDHYYTIMEKVYRDYYSRYDLITEELEKRYVSKNAVSTDNLRLRNGPDLDYGVITTIKKNTIVKIINMDFDPFVIDNLKGFFVKVEITTSNTKDTSGKAIPKGTTGWCFSGYLNINN